MLESCGAVVGKAARFWRSFDLEYPVQEEAKTRLESDGAGRSGVKTDWRSEIGAGRLREERG